MKSERIRKITDGSIIVALYGLIFLLGRFTGGHLESAISFALPLPLAIFAYKYNLKSSLIPFVASIVISFLLSVNPLNVLVYNIPYLIIGALLGGFLVKKNLNPVYSILIITVISVISEVLGTLVLSEFLGFENIFVEINNFVIKVEELIGVNSGDFVTIQALLEGLIPSIIAVVSLLISITVYLLFVMLAERILKCDFNKKVLQIFSLDNLIPKPLSIAYICISICAIVSLFFYSSCEGSIRVIFNVLINISIILGAVYLYFGIRVSSLFIRYTKKIWLLIIEFVLLMIASPLFVILGLIDNFFSLQKKIYNKITKRSEN